MPELKLRPGRTVFIMGIIWCSMVVAYCATQYYKRHGAPAKIHQLESAGVMLSDGERRAIENPRGMVKLFDLDGEQNIPALYQTLSLGAIAVLLFAIASHRKAIADPLTIYWKVLAWMFVFLMLDEGCSIHNNFHVYSAHTKAEQQKQGLFYFSWTLAYGVLMLPVGLWYLRFLLKLPRTYGVRIFVAGVVYVIGALGFEMAFGDYLAHGGMKGSKMELLFTMVEESMEMAGMLLFIHVLLKYMIEKRIAFGVTPAADVQRIAIKTLPPSSSEPGKRSSSSPQKNVGDNLAHAL